MIPLEMGMGTSYNELYLYTFSISEKGGKI